MEPHYTSIDRNYTTLIQNVLNQGKISQGRNGRTISTFGVQLQISELAFGRFPLLLGRQMFYKSVLGELAAFFRQPKHVNDFKVMKCNYWDLWAAEDGSLDLDYGNAWIDANGIDQIEFTIANLKSDPNSRRHLITGWSPDKVANGELSLPSCHYAYQWYVRNDSLDMIWVQRSCDLLIGIPADIILAAAWNIVMAHLTDLKPGVITMQLGDVHIYEEHMLGAIQYMRQVGELGDIQIQQYPKYELPRELRTYSDFLPSFIEIKEYKPQARINFELKE